MKVTTDITNVLCAKEGQKEENSTGLSIFEQLDNQEQLFISTEYVMLKLQSFLREQGIIHKTSISYVYQQNGHAE